MLRAVQVRCFLSLFCLLFGMVLLGGPPSDADPVIDQRLNDLRNIRVPPPLSSIPTDMAALPEGVLGLVSWNIQVGGLSTAPEADRPAMVQGALRRLFSGAYQILAAQEVSGPSNAELLAELLPGTEGGWTTLFLDSTSTQDNGFWTRVGVSPDSFTQLFLLDSGSKGGRTIPDQLRTTHPPTVAHFVVGNFDFTVINVHLTFASGDTGESARELREVLDYLDEYFNQPRYDPDVIVCGDFNIPSRLSGQAGSGGIVLETVFEDDPRFQSGDRRLVATVHEPTSRASVANGGAPRNNYDHFIFSADILEELVLARRVQPEVLTDDPHDPEQRLTSDHFPIVAFFETDGSGVALDALAPPRNAAITSVVHGASFGPAATRGSWLTIFGSDLATQTRIWRDDEIVQGRLPTSLDGVRVDVNGQPAAIFFVSPTQLNVQAPDVDALGPVSVELFQDGTKQAESVLNLQTAAPGLFMFDPLDRRYPAAVHADGTFVGPPGLFGEALTTRPVRSGDVILLFGAGFGPTDPEVPAGEVFTGAAPLVNPVRVLIDGIEAQVLFAGLTGAGLNQVNVVIPEAVSPGDATLFVETFGARTQEGVFLPVDGFGSPVPVPVVQLTAAPASITPGEAATLSWSVENADTVQIDNGIGGVPANGTRTVSPSQTTTYTLTATGPGGTRTFSATVIVTGDQFGPCGSKTTCGQMESCDEAKYFLQVCKVTRLDADKDGVPCESICPGG